jgi:hypothetical protein
MGSVSPKLVRGLRDAAGLRRAVETGTYLGTGTLLLATLFPEVLTIELSPELHAAAAERLGQNPRITVLQGNSAQRLREVLRPDVPTYFWLDGHWSGGVTAGEHDECPVLDELAALAPGHRDDCFVIDDARLFLAAPGPPHDPSQWPTLLELVDQIRAIRPEHLVTLLNNQVIAAPPCAREFVNRYGRQVLTPSRWATYFDMGRARLRACTTRLGRWLP